jgi:hypothetical protein
MGYTIYIRREITQREIREEAFIKMPLKHAQK